MLKVVFASSLLVGCVVGDGEVDEDVGETRALRSVSPGAPAPAAAAGKLTFSSHVDEQGLSVPVRSTEKWRVIYSVPVPALTTAEALEVHGEVMLSMCAPKELQDSTSPCKSLQAPTPFAPRITAKIVLGDTPSATTGTPLSDMEPSLSCSREEHHCTLVVRRTQKGNLSGDRYVNLVVAATGPSTKDLVRVEQQKGGVYVTRIGSGANSGSFDAAGGVQNNTLLSIQNGVHPNRIPRVLFQRRIDDAKPGDIVDIEASVKATIKQADPNCSPLITHQVFVSEGTDPTQGGKLVEITAKNGTNCTNNSCSYKKTGAGQLPGNTPTSVYVSLVAWAGRSCSSAGDEWKADSGSSMNVRRRR